jgi:lauroyl/myristoyl acyltransferase
VSPAIARRAASSLLANFKGGGRLQAFVGHLFLAVIMVGILRPAARMLSYPRALSLARTFGFVHAFMPWFGRGIRRQFLHAFGPSLGAARTAEVAARHLARPLCDSVVLRRALLGKPDVDRLRVEQRSSPEVDAILRSDESFILATGHFSRQAFVALGMPGILAHRITSVSLPRIARTWHPRTWWLGYHYGQILDYSRVLRPEIEFVYPDCLRSYKQLMGALRRPGNVVIIHADAPWMLAQVGNYSRPFAGLESRRFATGAARLSRSIGCPIVVCVPYLQDDRTIVLEWTRVVRPSSSEDGTAEERAMDLVLDDIERAIGRRPDQYVLPFLGSRRWDPAAERWLH